MTRTEELEATLRRAERYAREAISMTRPDRPHRDYAELHRRMDDAEAVLDLLRQADELASLARAAEHSEEAVERAEAAKSVARSARDEAARRAHVVDAS
jgi:hypothetical protein